MMPWFPADFSFLPPLLASGLCASVVVHLWQRRDELGAPWLLALTGSVGLINAGAVWGAVLAGPEVALGVAPFTHVMRVTGSLAWLGFALAYSGLVAPGVRGSWVLAVGLLTTGLATAGLLSGSELTATAEGLAAWLGWSSIGLATVIILTHLAQAPDHWAQRVVVLAAPAVVGAGAMLPSLAGSGSGFLLGADPVPVASALAAALVAHVLIGDRPTGAEPVARSVVVEEMEDPVLVLGRDGRPVDLNRAARTRLGLEIRGPLPVEIGTLWASSWESLRRGVVGPAARVELELVYGTRATFELTMTPLGPRAGRSRTVLVLRDITERVRIERELHRATESLRLMANTDGLTGLANRRGFEERLREEAERAHRYERPLSLVLLDLDHFKTVNDTWGHPVGDRVLKGTAEVLRSVLREMDVAGRLGGEELAVLLPETDAGGAEALAERLRRQIRDFEHRSDDDRPFHVTASLGIACLAPGAGSDVETLFSTADQALYAAKGGGRDRVVTKAVEPSGRSRGFPAADHGRSSVADVGAGH